MPAVLLDAIRVPGHEGSILGQTADFYEGPKVVSVRLPKRFEKGARRVLQGLYSSIRVLLSSGREGGREGEKERERETEGRKERDLEVSENQIRQYGHYLRGSFLDSNLSKVAL